MGLHEKQPGATWLTAQNGFFMLSVDENAPGAIKRTNKLGKEVWEKQYSKIDGMITGLFIQEPPAASPEYGKSLIVYLQDNADRFAVRMPLSGSYALGFLGRVAGVDPLKRAALRIFDKPREDKPEKLNRILFIQQHNTAEGKDVSIKSIWSFTEKGEGENELPDLVCLKEATKKTKAVWDDSERLEFLEKYALRMNAKFKVNAASVPAQATPHTDAIVSDGETNDDLPF